MPCASKYRRTPPATVASTTSLTEPPRAFLTALTSSSGVAKVQNRRLGPTLPFSGVSLAADSQPDDSE